LQSAVAQVEIAREGRPPARFEDGAVQSFDVAVGLWTAGADLGLASAERRDRVAEMVGELVPLSVRTRSRRQPAWRRVRATRCAKRLVWPWSGPGPSQRTSSAHAKLL
jgi:hypothetical protein